MKEVKIISDHLYSKIEGEIPVEVQQVCTLRYDYWTQDWYTKRKEIKTKMLSYLSVTNGGHYFPSGWYNKVVQTYEDLGYEVIKETKSLEELHHNPLETKAFELRDYQVSYVAEALNLQRCTIVAPTGAGKTIIYASILIYLGLPSLVMVPSINLLNQALSDIKRLVKDESLVGQIGDSIWDPKLITVATVQSLWSKIGQKQMADFLAKVKVLVIEECHHVKNSGAVLKNTYFKIAMTIPAAYRYGFTATPGKEESLSRKLLEAATGPCLELISASELVDRGTLAKPTIEIHTVEIPFEKRIGGWTEAYEHNILGNIPRNTKIANLAVRHAAEGKSVLVICDRIDKHGVILNAMIPESILLTGRVDDSETRQQIISDFGAKRFKILISTLINEGVNIPSMDVIILAQAGKGGDEGRLLIQRIGRAMRIAEGKDTALIIDFFDKDGGILEKHSKARLKLYKEEPAYTVNILNPTPSKIREVKVDDSTPRGLDFKRMKF